MTREVLIARSAEADLAIADSRRELVRGRPARDDNRRRRHFFSGLV
jgi:hypothetical protein